jgi:hypothetical protein
MPDVFFGGQQSFQASLRLLIVAVHIHKNLSRTPVISHVYRGYTNQADARIGQFALDQRFDFLPQGLAEPPAMVFESALFHLALLGKTQENIRKQTARVGLLVPLSRTIVAFG